MSGPTVVLSGMVAGTPGQGGASWAILQYLLGLRRLGCDVHLVEPVAAATLEASSRYAKHAMASAGLDGHWTLLPDDGTDPVGGTRVELLALADRTDVLVNVSGMLTDPEVLERIETRVYLDLDPAFAQLWHAVDGVDMRFDAHTHFVTVADGIGRPECSIPACGRDWRPTLPPVVLARWPVAEGPGDGVTTVANWRGYGSIHHGGVRYGQKAHSVRRLMGLPARTRACLRLALAIHPDEVEDLAALRANGWELVDPSTAAATPEQYRRFVQGSRAELGIAKEGYVVSNSGWFSDRSACYLASGRPVVAQDTGFGRRLPIGAGLFAFTTTDDAAAALAEVDDDYDGHRAAARAIAEEHLDSDVVLDALLEWVGVGVC